MFKYAANTRKMPPFESAVPQMTPDELKKAVAQAALDFVVPQLENDSIIGIGTGSTANFFIDLLAEHKHKFEGAVASSQASAERLQKHGIPVYGLNGVEVLGFYVDGADEANRKLQLVKGGGGALTREKIVAACSETFVCIADESKWVETLGKFPLPVEVIPMARAYVAREIVALGGRPEHRHSFISDNGNEILDVHDLNIHDPIALENRLNQITGVVSNGLFAARPADILFLGTQHGVEVKKL